MKNRMLKYTLTFFLSFISFVAFSKTYTSKDNHTGYWAEKNTWDVNEIPDLSKNGTIDIYGFVTLQGSALTTTFNMATTITIHDTLVVEGSLDLKKDATLNIETGGVLIILGNLTTAKDLIANINSYLVVAGEFSTKQDASISITDPSQVFLFGGVDTNPPLDGSKYQDYPPPPSTDIGSLYCGVQNISGGAIIDCSNNLLPINECTPVNSISFMMPNITGSLTCNSGEIFWTLYDSNNQIYDGQSGKAAANSTVTVNTSLLSGSYYIKFQFGNSFCSQDIIISNPPTTGTITK
ncbi:hypothetical protein [Prolixibacter sp. SD074]|jgi:hypothetical protein|uniref:hypothetical protein n=1 Tax=Prolixibacter sp. SD074 TaxID=2652391 RepID=UPI001285C26E|nr:hypothetical protein [Prolixibacter sp. SD074]GET30640.1 hypothetical protein SD074_28420 [Prolixibacter sp. SD074]